MSVPVTSRRRFLAASSSAASALILPGGTLFGKNASPNGKLNVAAIGAGGKGAVDTDGCASENIVALCDVDARTLAKRQQAYPKARVFKDYRVMLEQMGDQIDAVTVSTPDHTHFHASMLAMEHGIHVYCQKPLTHSVWEAREMLKKAREKKVVTQMGNQGHAYDSTRRLVEVVRSGAIGEVREVHVWTDRPIWPQGVERPTSAEPVPVPEHLDWDLWLGPAPERPYQPGYHPFKWRGFWDFGTGALGDMGCHNIDAAFWALELGAPESVEVRGASLITEESPPKASVIRYRFPERATAGASLPPVTLTWYDGGEQPDPALIGETALPKNGSIILGSKGSIAFRDWNPDNFRLLPEERFKDFEDPPRTLPRVGGDPYREWLTACKGGAPCLTNFEYAVPLTEMVLLGNVALRAGGKLDWDAAALKATGRPDADQFLRREYREGWMP